MRAPFAALAALSIAALALCVPPARAQAPRDTAAAMALYREAAAKFAELIRSYDLRADQLCRGQRIELMSQVEICTSAMRVLHLCFQLRFDVVFHISQGSIGRIGEDTDFTHKVQMPDLCRARSSSEVGNLPGRDQQVFPVSILF